MSPDERRLGELIGEVRGLADRIAEMKRENAADHQEVVEALNGVRSELGKKASNERVTEVEKRTDKLESRADKLMAIVSLMVLVGPLVLGVLLQRLAG